MKEIVELAARVADLERRFAGNIRHGVVASVDPAKATMRLQMGTDVEGKPFLSPEIPYGQTAGAFKWHNPPSVGQQMSIYSPTGDWMQAIAFPMHWSEQNPSPSQKGDEHVMTFGSVKITIKGDSIIIDCPNIEINMKDFKMKGDNALIDAMTDLGGEGGEYVHREHDIDSDNDYAVTHAKRVRAK